MGEGGADSSGGGPASTPTSTPTSRPASVVGPADDGAPVLLHALATATPASASTRQSGVIRRVAIPLTLMIGARKRVNPTRATPTLQSFEAAHDLAQCVLTVSC